MNTPSCIHRIDCMFAICAHRSHVEYSGSQCRSCGQTRLAEQILVIKQSAAADDVGKIFKTAKPEARLMFCLVFLLVRYDCCFLMCFAMLVICVIVVQACNSMRPLTPVKDDAERRQDHQRNRSFGGSSDNVEVVQTQLKLQIRRSLKRTCSFSALYSSCGCCW